MVIKKSRMLCLIAFALVVSGCSDSGGGSGSDNTTEIFEIDTQIVDDAVDASITADEVAMSTDVSAGVATDLPSISSAEMDEFIVNPLLSAIPAELRGEKAITHAVNFIANPLLN